MDKKSYPVLVLTLSLAMTGCGGSDPVTEGVMSRSAASVTVAPATDYNELIQRIYVAYFGRPADAEGLAFWSNAYRQANIPLDIGSLLTAYDSSPTVKYLVDIFGRSLESQDLYDDNDHAAFVNSVYRNLYNRDAEPQGRDFWTKAITDGVLTKPVVALAIMGGAQGTDSESISKKVAAASHFTSLFTPADLASAYSGNAAISVARRTLNKITGSTTAIDLEEIVRLSVPEVIRVPTLPAYKLATYAAGAGRGTVTPVSGTFREGEQITVRAQPDYFSEFAGWSQRSVCAGGLGGCRVTIESDTVAEARFDPTEVFFGGEMTLNASRETDDGRICRWNVVWEKIDVVIRTAYTASGRTNTLRVTGKFDAAPLTEDCDPSSQTIDKTFNIPPIGRSFNETVMVVDGAGDQLLTVAGEVPGPGYGNILPAGLVTMSLRYANAKNAKGEAHIPMSLLHRRRAR
ncbi:DUF4214 domain-containing protein [Telluria beijingensis]|uniref:DUF4214 domain-containing protein n=1 Tax=Telluria beijingensis TaxID=3068633 RepID=UPI0027958AFC|nr:DUF4214 domain-containing protein [Massilia sp. REN29]